MLETPCGGSSSHSWGRAALLGLGRPSALWEMCQWHSTGINEGFVSYPAVLSPVTPARVTCGPGERCLKQQGQEISWPCLAPVGASHPRSFVIHAGIAVGVENVCLTFQQGSHHREHPGQGLSCPPALCQDAPGLLCHHSMPRAAGET